MNKQKLVPVFKHNDIEYFADTHLLKPFFPKEDSEVRSYQSKTSALAFNTPIKFLSVCSNYSVLVPVGDVMNRQIVEEDLSVSAVYLSVKDPASHKRVAVKLTGEGNELLQASAVASLHNVRACEFHLYTFTGSLDIPGTAADKFVVSLTLDIHGKLDLDTSVVRMNTGDQPLLCNLKPLKADQPFIAQDMKILSKLFAEADYLGYDLSAHCVEKTKESA